jgi:hypothetical protein
MAFSHGQRTSSASVGMRTSHAFAPVEIPQIRISKNTTTEAVGPKQINQSDQPSTIAEAVGPKQINQH